MGDEKPLYRCQINDQEPELLSTNEMEAWKGRVSFKFAAVGERITIEKVR